MYSVCIITVDLNQCFIIVPDRRSRILEVIIVRRIVTWVLGIGGGREWERVEKGEVSLQAT